VDSRKTFLSKGKNRVPSVHGVYKYSKPLVGNQNDSSDTDRKIFRCKYLKVYRPERIMLKYMYASYMYVNTRKTYKANRFMYYCVLPHVAKYLWWGPDRESVIQVERFLYDQILSYLFHNKDRKKPPDRVTLFNKNHWSHSNETLERCSRFGKALKSPARSDFTYVLRPFWAL